MHTILIVELYNSCNHKVKTCLLFLNNSEERERVMCARCCAFVGLRLCDHKDRRVGFLPDHHQTFFSPIRNFSLITNSLTLSDMYISPKSTSSFNSTLTLICTYILGRALR